MYKVWYHYYIERVLVRRRQTLVEFGVCSEIPPTGLYSYYGNQIPTEIEMIVNIYRLTRFSSSCLNDKNVSIFYYILLTVSILFACRFDVRLV